MRNEGPYVKFPVKRGAGYDFIKVPTPVKGQTETATGDDTTHHRYVRTTVTHKWFIPKDEQITQTRS